MYKRIGENKRKKPLQIVELKTTTKEEIEEFKKHLQPLRRVGVEVVE